MSPCKESEGTYACIHTHTRTHTRSIHMYVNTESRVTVVKINSELVSVLILSKAERRSMRSCK